MYVCSWELEIMSKLKFLTSMTHFCDFLLSVLSGLASFPTSGGVFCFLALCPLDSRLYRGWFLVWPSPRQSSPSFEWVTASLCCFTWKSCLSSQPPASWSRSSNLRVQWKAPDKPQGYAPCAGFRTDSQRVSWQSVTPTLLYQWWSYSREAIGTS